MPQIKKRRKPGFLNLRCNFCRTNEEVMADATSYTVKTRIFHKPEEKTQIFEEDFSVDPITRQACPKCGFLKAYYWEGNNRRKLELEPLTYYRCVKCKNTWND